MQTAIAQHRSKDLPPGLILDDGRLLYKYQHTTYELRPFPLEEKRIEEVFELSKQAGFDDTLEDWKQHLRLARFAYAFIDIETDRLITTGMAVVFDNRLVRIIDILTDHSHRNRGLAKTLLGYLLYLISHDPDLESLELEASALGSGLYEKFSFKTDYKIVSYVREPNPAANKCEEQQYIVNDHDLKEIIQLDQKVCGFSRAALIYETLKSQIFVDKDEQIKGFLFCLEDSSGMRIGPMVHTTVDGVCKLLRDSLRVINRKDPMKKVYIHVPDFHPEEVLKTLKELGFTKDDAIQTNHMFRGVKIPRNRQCYFAIWSTNWS
jgi:GNAT superfamily N-acetyltransferase